MASATITAFLESLPPGFRFSPTDDELVNYYLKKKMMGNDHLDSIVPDVNIYKFEPWDLPRRFPKGIKTKWVMHEFVPSFNLPQQKDYVICRLPKNTDKTPTVEDGESSPVISSDFENQIPDESHGTAMSEEGESVQIMIHPGSELQTPNENIGIPISDYCESNAITMASDFENQKATEVNYTPTIEETLDPIMASDFGNQNVTEVNYTPTTEGAPDPLRASDHPFDLPEEMWAYLEPFNGFDENDFNL